MDLFSHMGTVTRSVEFRRISALSRRVLDLSKVEDVTPLFRKPGGTFKFWPVQSAALVEASLSNGLFAPIGVGHGKGLITLTLPSALGSDKAVLLVPPQLKRQLIEKEIPKYAAHFDLPLDTITIVSYSELSSADQADILDEIDPDLIIADEAHNLRHPDAARTRRFIRFFKQHPECRFCGLSGTLTTRSLLDYAHLIELALRGRSPIPLSWREQQDWAGAIDVKPLRPAHPGVLREFCDKGESIRDGFRRRLRETAGVVATDEGAEVASSLIVRKVSFALPEKVAKLMKKVGKEWEIDGEQFDSPLALNRFMRQIACGFYLKWKWPGGTADREWLDARAAWNREVREYLSHRARPGMDSPGLLTEAAMRGDWKPTTWGKWVSVMDRPEPASEAVWIDDFMVKAIQKWLKASDVRAVVWVEHTALGERLRECGWAYYDEKDSTFAEEESIACSLHSQREGKNLQDRYSRMLFTTIPANGSWVEQAIGRCHRPGQEADEVLVEWFNHTPLMEASFEAAMADARYQQETLGAKQKLLYANHL
jgi:hypothetical protein